MNTRSGLKLAALAYSLLCAPVSAATVTLDFDQFGDPDVPSSGNQAGAPVGPIGFINANHGLYDAYLPSILLGDDGWDKSISFDAREGYVFDAVSLRFITGQQNVFYAPLSGAVDMTSPFLQLQEALRTDSLTRYVIPNVVFKGYRDGNVVAMQVETYDGEPNVTQTFGNGFTDLDRLVVGLDFGYGNGDDPVIVGNWLYYCPNERCGMLKFDDLLLNVQAASDQNFAAVPLPAPALMLTTAMLGMVSFTRRNRAARA